MMQPIHQFRINSGQNAFRLSQPFERRSMGIRLTDPSFGERSRELLSIDRIGKGGELLSVAVSNDQLRRPIVRRGERDISESLGKRMGFLLGHRDYHEILHDLS